MNVNSLWPWVKSMKENTLMTQKASCIDENIGMTY